MSSREPEKKFSHSQILAARLKPNFTREGKIGRHLFTSSFKREIRKLHMVVYVKETTKNVPKSAMQVQSRLFIYLF